MSRLSSFIITILVFIIKAYQKLISPLKPGICRCRFYPTCSVYCIEVLKRHGVIKGTLLSIWRIIRCNPFSRGGFDPAP